MPTASYQELLAETLPAQIKSDPEYERLYRRIRELFRQPRRTSAENRLFQLLSVLIQDYDRRNTLLPTNDSPAERLKYLLEVAGKTPADLLPIFGQRSHVNEVLNGKRPMSAAQARKLGAMFHLNPGYFL